MLDDRVPGLTLITSTLQLRCVQAHLDWAGKKVPLYAKVASIKGQRAPAVVIPGEGSGPVPLAASDTTWDAFIAPARQDPAAVLTFKATVVTPDTVSNVLFSSGTTGTPKAIPWTHVTPLRWASTGPFAHACGTTACGHASRGSTASESYIRAFQSPYRLVLHVRMRTARIRTACAQSINAEAGTTDRTILAARSSNKRLPDQRPHTPAMHRGRVPEFHVEAVSELSDLSDWAIRCPLRGYSSIRIAATAALRHCLSCTTTQARA